MLISAFGFAGSYGYICSKDSVNVTAGLKTQPGIHCCNRKSICVTGHLNLGTLENIV